MNQSLINNVIEGFNLPLNKMIALNYWGDDKKSAEQIKETLERKGHNVYLHIVNLNEVKSKASQDGIVHLSDDVITAIASSEVAIDVFSHPVKAPEGFEGDTLQTFKMMLGKLFQAMKNDKETFIQWRLPTEENAGTIDRDVFIEAISKACMVDYKNLRKRADYLEKLLYGKQTVHIKAEKTDLTFDIYGTKWFKDVGDGDIPAGEIACLPNAKTANGTFFVPKLRLRELTFDNLEFTIKEGVFKTDNEAFNTFLNAFKGDKDTLAEFGLGLNDKIESLIGNQLHDEKKLHTVHLGIGKNQMVGGDNNSNSHIDLVIEAREVTVDDLPIIEASKLVLR